MIIIEWLQAYGPNMVPTFNLTGDMFLAERLSIKLGKVGPEDIVLLRSHKSPRKVMVKRLLGLESHSVTYVVDPMKSDRCDTIVVSIIIHHFNFVFFEFGFCC